MKRSDGEKLFLILAAVGQRTTKPLAWLYTTHANGQIPSIFRHKTKQAGSRNLLDSNAYSWAKEAENNHRM